MMTSYTGFLSSTENVILMTEKWNGLEKQINEQ